MLRFKTNGNWEIFVCELERGNLPVVPQAKVAFRDYYFYDDYRGFFCWYAVQNGNLEILQEVYRRGFHPVPDSDVSWQIAALGHLYILKWLHDENLLCLT